MALIDIFKRKPKEKAEKLPKKKKEVKEEKPKEEAPKKVEKKKESLAWRFLKSPQITEKATELSKGNRYTFKVSSESSKAEVRKAVEQLYGVDVLGVNVIRVPRKQRRLGRITGWRKGYKKAIVRIKEGQKIEVMPR
ncbi:MAG: large subunit ribosomal protein L23 [Parcubacteria group bacterium Gr01-1014_30]|nr:MAG: large subunit ribosomal protein L23 [Parcubacteria group bacterium Gr01-1014_30]